MRKRKRRGRVEEQLPKKELSQVLDSRIVEAITEGVKTYGYDKAYLNYIEFAKKYNNVDVSMERLANELLQVIDTYYEVPEDEIDNFTVWIKGIIPQFIRAYLFSPYTKNSLEGTFILSYHNNKILNLTGKGVIVGIVDSGIDYLHPVFQTKEGKTRILEIWDQSIKGNPPKKQFFGSLYNQVEIQNAIDLSKQGGDPYTIVPSKDVTGHGTYLAGVAAGGEYQEGEIDFVGAAPDADMIVVKAKGALQFQKDIFNISNDNIPYYNAVNIYQGIEYIGEYALRANKPAVIFIGLGTNQGSHDDRVLGAERLEKFARQPGIVLLCCVGNEGDISHHAKIMLTKEGQSDRFVLKVGPEDKNFVISMWGGLGDLFTVTVTSPGGQTTEYISVEIDQFEETDFILEQTQIFVSYEVFNDVSGCQLINLRFNNAREGIWYIDITAVQVIVGVIHAYLPRTGWISEQTVFLSPNFFTTVTVPGSINAFITVGAYDSSTESVYQASSRGFTRQNEVKPDIIAPGVDILGPKPGGGFTVKNGTSAATAIAAGAAAQLVQWDFQIVGGQTLNTPQVRGLFALGSNKSKNIYYPSPDWGYGGINMERIFKTIT